MIFLNQTHMYPSFREGMGEMNSCTVSQSFLKDFLALSTKESEFREVRNHLQILSHCIPETAQDQERVCAMLQELDNAARSLAVRKEELNAQVLKAHLKTGAIVTTSTHDTYLVMQAEAAYIFYNTLTGGTFLFNKDAHVTFDTWDCDFEAEDVKYTCTGYADLSGYEWYTDINELADIQQTLDRIGKDIQSIELAEEWDQLHALKIELSEELKGYLVKIKKDLEEIYPLQIPLYMD